MCTNLTRYLAPFMGNVCLIVLSDLNFLGLAEMLDALISKLEFRIDPLSID
jgi:hypothetical protein